VQKSSWYSGFYSVSIFNAVDRDVHARKKRVISHAFSDQALRGMEPHIISAICDWCRALGDGLDPQTAPNVGEWSRPKDMAHYGACVIFDALGEICFGRTFETSVKEDSHFFFDLMALNVRILNICERCPSCAVSGWTRTSAAGLRRAGNGRSSSLASS